MQVGFHSIVLIVWFEEAPNVGSLTFIFHKQVDFGAFYNDIHKF